MANNNGYMATIGVDTSGFDTALRDLTRELGQIDRALQNDAQNTTLLSQRYTVLQEAATQTAARLQQLQDAGTAAQQALNAGQLDPAQYRAYQREVEITTQRLADLQAQMNAMGAGGTGNGNGNGQGSGGLPDAQQLANYAEGLQKIAGYADKAADALADAFLGAVKSVGGYIANMAQEASDLYGNYQQLVGGVETLFGDDYQTVLTNADNAFRNMGISANEYMETATSFAASLVSSLDGDTAQAAKSVDLALQDMADNSNKMGTAMQSIQNAYQGFAKQQYQLLDNLMLGYGGTKGEMERLLKDAQALTGVKYDISSLDDIINAIHVIQTDIGITGTTAEEANKTIEGSANAVKAAWTNLLTAMGDPSNQQGINAATDRLGQMVQDFVDTAITSIDNMMPSIEAAILGMGDVIEKLAPIIRENLPRLIDDITPALTEALSTLLGVASEVVSQNLPILIDTVKQALREIWNNTDSNVKGVVATVAAAWAGLKSLGIASSITSLITQLGGTNGLAGGLQTISNVLNTDVMPILGSFRNFLNTDLSTAWANMGTSATTALNNIQTAINSTTGLLVAAAVAIAAIVKVSEELDTISQGMLAETTNEINAKKRSEDIRKEIEELNEMPVSLEQYEKLKTALDDVRQAREEWAQSYAKTNQRIVELEGKTFMTAAETAELKKLQQERDTLDAEYAALDLYEVQINNRLEKYSDEAIRNLERTSEAQANALKGVGKTSADTAGEVLKNTNERWMEELTEEMKNLDHLLAIHQISEDDYWTKRQEFLEKYRVEEDEQWNKWMDENIGHYDKLAEEEKKAQEKAEKERQQEAEKRKREQEKKQREAEQARKSALTQAFSDIAHEAKMNDYDQGWILERQREYLDTLDKSTDLYKEYDRKWQEDNKDWQDKQKEEKQKAEKEAMDAYFEKLEKTAEANGYSREWILEQQKAYIDTLDKSSQLYKDAIEKWSDDTEEFEKERDKERQKLIDEGKSAAEKLIAEYEKGQQSIMNAVNKPTKVTDINGNERLVFTDFQKKLQELRTYQKNLDKLGDLRLSEQHLKDIFSMDLDTRMKYVSELLRMSEGNRQRYLNDYEAYYKAAGNVSQTEVDLSGKDDEILNEGIQKGLDKITGESKIAGKEAREAWLQGWKEGGGEFYEDMLPAFKEMDATTRPDTMVTQVLQTAFGALSDKPLTINVAGTQAIKMTLGQLLTALKNSGGALDV